MTRPGTTRLKLVLAYDGRAFRGWQSQAGAEAVQDHIEAALESLCGTRIVVHGSGRTDAGVHALGQIAHVDVPAARFDPVTWAKAINARLPFEVRILRASRAKAGFHAQYSACGKEYLYRIWSAPVLHPLEIGRAWHVPGPLDFSVLCTAARRLEGTHDFASFAANRGHPVSDTVRTIHSIQVKRRGAQITLRFSGSGFLYRMVRLMTGSLVRCAVGKAREPWLTELLESKGGTKTSFGAPAEGLYLARVRYPRSPCL
jgi:tRNA pseudouridine38-40 synthase